MTIARLHVDNATAGAAELGRQSTGLKWLALDAIFALQASADARKASPDWGPSQLIGQVVEFCTTSETDLNARIEIFQLADASIGGGWGELPERLVEALLAQELKISPERAFEIIEANWDAIGGDDGRADWGDFQDCYDETDDPEFKAALDLWRVLMYDLVEVANDGDDFSVGSDGLDGRRDDVITLDDLAAFREDNPDLNLWWAQRQERRDSLLPYTLTGDQAVAIVIDNWGQIGGGDQLADWGDLESLYNQTGDPELRAAIDLLRGPLFSQIEVMNDDDSPALDDRGADVRIDGKIHLNDFTAFMDSLGDTSVQDYMDTNGIAPPVLRLPDPMNHVDHTTIVVLSGSVELALKGEAELGYRVHQIADGSYVVERIAGIGIGHEQGAGFKAEVRTGQSTHGVAAIAEAGVMARLEAEQAWLMNDGDEVQTLIVSQAIDIFPHGASITGAADFAADRVDDVTPEPVEDAVGWGVSHLPYIGDDLVNANDAAQRYVRYDEPDSYVATVGISTSITGEASARMPGAAAWLEGEVSGGRSGQRYGNGDTSITYTLAGEASAGVVFGPQALIPLNIPEPLMDQVWNPDPWVDENISGAIEISVADVSSADGQPKEVVVTVTAQVNDELSVTTMTYDAGDPDAATAGQHIVRAFDTPTSVFDVDGAISSVGSIDDAYNALANQGDISGTTNTTTSWIVDTSNYGFTVEGTILEGAGVDANVEITHLSPAEDGDR